MSKLRKRHHQSVAESRPFEGLSRIHRHAAGVDIGAHEIMVGVPGPDDTQLVRAFGTYTIDLYALAEWLSEHHIETVATPQGCRRLWNRLACTGFRCSRRSKHAASSAV